MLCKTIQVFRGVEMRAKEKWRLSPKVTIVFWAVLIFVPALVSSEETYKFERMWPTLQQPWYFFDPEIAFDTKGNIYFADRGHDRVQKFSLDGTFITKWGTSGTDDGELNLPSGIAVDSDGNIYVADTDNDRIQKFTAHGDFIEKWDRQGSGDGEFSSPSGLSIDSSGYIYVVDMGNNRIQKLNSKGEFISKWGQAGIGNGEFNNPWGIAIDNSDNIYVVDVDNKRVQKFDKDGNFIISWDVDVPGNKPHSRLHGVAVDSQGYVYVTDSENIQKFNSNGQFIKNWGNIHIYTIGIAIDANDILYLVMNNHTIRRFNPDESLISNWGSERLEGEKGSFSNPTAVAVDNNGYVYITDYSGSIQKFSADGNYITEMGGYGSDEGKFFAPDGIAIDANGYIYIAEGNCLFDENFVNNRVQKLAPDGTFVTKWGQTGSGNGEFQFPNGIAVDTKGYVYIADTGNHRIQKFSSDGTFVTKWGEKGTGAGEFDSPTSIAVNNSGYVYVADSSNSRVQIFNSDGAFISMWGSQGYGPGEFSDQLDDIALDASGKVYVADRWNYEIKVFTADGTYITEFGGYGTDPGLFNYPSGLCVTETDKIYVTEFLTHRVQVFQTNGDPGPPQTVSKCIIVAGGGPFTGNNLWDATEMCANYAYRALTYQGYSKENLYYLSSDTDLDLDGNGKLDDVDADATNANLEYAIKTWASDAQDLFIYMVDHGGNGTFRMGETELLYATNLDAWLDTIQQTLPGCVTMVYDACESGSFLPYLLPPAGKQRILATSTSSGEESIFVGNGTVSFSFLFWGHMFNGDSFYDAFVNAKQSVSTTYNLTPQLDGNGNGIGNEKADKDAANLIRVGNETKSAGDVPVIGGVSPAQSLEGSTSATIYAEQVTDANGISRVWAVITPPDYSTGTPDTPVTDLPTIDLNSVGNNRYEGTYTNFTSSGTYNIAIFAMDRKGVLSLPVQTSVITTSSCLAVAGDLSIKVPCALYNSTRYGFVLDFYRNPDDPPGYYWKLVMATLTAGAGTDCIPIGSDLSMPMSCVSYNSTQYGFTLRFYNNSYDPSGLYWKMDMSTLEVK